MKKNFKVMVMSLVLAMSVLVSIIQAQAAITVAQPKISKSSRCNEWRFWTPSSYTIYVGQHAAVWLVNDINGKKVTWKSSNTKIATVDKYGNVTGKKPGKVTITVTDGTHTSKAKITVKALKSAKKNEVIFNYGDVNSKGFLTMLVYGKTYTLKTLKGSSVDRIIGGNESDWIIKGTKFTPVPKADCRMSLRVILKNGKKYWLDFSCTSSKEREEAIAIAKEGMKEYGVTTKSSDLEKAMFIYNWNGDKIEEVGATSHGCTSPGHYSGVRKGYGDCDVHAEAVQLLADVVGIPVVKIFSSEANHAYNGICVDGKWYLMDTMQCESWAFALGNHVNFLSSYVHAVGYDKACYTFTVHPDALKDIVFTSTKYDEASWPEYRDKYDVAHADDPALDPDFWND